MNLTRQALANAVRFLAMDAVQKANSGHPGMPMGMADVAEVLWNDYIQCNPRHPGWFNRDRFIVSNGHGAMLQYAVLHLSGFEVTIGDLKKFRQLHSKTPGHPEYGDTPGVETTTGPLGQGLANAVGMALAEKKLAAEFNRPDFPLVDHYTYVFCGDGCLMEGVSHEACSLAGTLGLGKLIVFWDDNGISIDGDLSGWFTDATPKRFEAYHWQVIDQVDGHNPEAIKAAIEMARSDLTRPTLICCKTQIGFGSPNLVGSEKTHGSPLGEAEIVATRLALNWLHPPFQIPNATYAAWSHLEKGEDRELLWNHLFVQYETHYPELAHEFLRRMQGFLPENFAQSSSEFIVSSTEFLQEEATRKSSLRCIQDLAAKVPELIGGSADLSESNCTLWKNAGERYIHYGVREFGMAAIMNGLSLHGGYIPFGGTFLVFSDYARNAIRLSALMQAKVIYILTHDSIGLGEDGPTHQPVEHAASLRLIPELHVWRPCDLVETAVAWQQSIQYKGASCLLLSRQNLVQQMHPEVQDIHRGAYILIDTDKTPEAIIIATGSEVNLAVEVAIQYNQAGRHIRVVSMPCADVFKMQASAYQQHVLPTGVTARLAIEAGVSDYWYQFVGLKGRVIGLDHFGLSAPAQKIFTEFGFTVENVKRQLNELLLLEEVLC